MTEHVIPKRGVIVALRGTRPEGTCADTSSSSLPCCSKWRHAVHEEYAQKPVLSPKKEPQPPTTTLETFTGPSRGSIVNGIAMDC